MERRNPDKSDEKSASEDKSWFPDEESDCMDIEDEEEEMVSASQSDIMEEEKVPPVASRTRHGTWVIRYHKHENASGVSYIHKSLANEHAEAIKQLETKKKNSSRLKMKSNSPPNELFFNSTNHKAHIYQTFIPNQVKSLFRTHMYH